MKAEPERIRQAAGRMSDLADSMWDDVEALRRDSEALMASSWTGDAADTHRALWSEWVESARQAVGALTAQAGLLHHAADAYEVTDLANADRTL